MKILTSLLMVLLVVGIGLISIKIASKYMRKIILKESERSGYQSALKKIDILNYAQFILVNIPISLGFSFAASNFIENIIKYYNMDFDIPKEDIGRIIYIVFLIISIAYIYIVNDFEMNVAKSLICQAKDPTHAVHTKKYKPFKTIILTLLRSISSIIFLGIYYMLFFIMELHISILLICLITLNTITAILLVDYIQSFYCWYEFSPVTINSLSLKARLERLLNKYNMQHTIMAEYHTHMDNHINIFCFGLFNKKIYFSNSLIQNLDYVELESLLIHEICHLKKHHLFKAVLLLISLLSIFGFWFRFSSQTNIFLFFLYLAAIVYVWGFVSKKQEIEADKYVVINGIEPQVYISALQKLHIKNDSFILSGEFGEMFSTHPSLENRIKYINEFAKSMGS